MGITVHHKPADDTASWNIHVWEAAWDGNNVWDTKGAARPNIMDFQLPDAPDPRKLQFKYRSTTPVTGDFSWEADDFIRRLSLTSPTEVWTFESSPRVLYQNPFPVDVVFNPGDVLTFQVITKNAFRGGQLYVWNPYDSTVQPAYFGESARDDDKEVSTFSVTLTHWMTLGFNLKLVQPATGDHAPVWESDASNRVWRPCDGASSWLKSGQCDVRSTPLELTPVTLEVLYSAGLSSPPQMALQDWVEGSVFPLVCSSVQPYSGSSLFNVGTYSVPIYPQAAYAVTSQQNVEKPPLQRPFPAEPTALDVVSRFVLGAGAWVGVFPAIVPFPLSIKPHASSFAGGLSVQVYVGNGPSYETVPATLQPDGTWQATLDAALDTRTSINLLPAIGTEPTPYDWIDTRRYFTPTASTPKFCTTEGVYGVCARGETRFADPSDRTALMQAAFGNAVASAGIFGASEMPLGATSVGGDIYFVVHAPHAVCGTLILADETAPGGPARQEFPMTLTNDTLYWWCSLPASQAPHGTRYHFLLNDDVEVIDPATRAVQDGGSLKTSFGES